MPPRKATAQRAHRSFWTLVGVASIAMGALSGALAKHPGPLTGMFVATSGAIALLSLALAARIMIALDRARRGAASAAPDGSQASNRQKSQP